MERHRWRTHYSTLYPLPCPRCGKGLLKWRKDALLKREPAYSKLNRDVDPLTPELIHEVFTSFMVCEVGYCGETVVVSGFISYADDVPPSEENPTPDWTPYYFPENFYPAPAVIPISGKLSPECTHALRSAFGLLWSDRPACANRLRSFVEHLMDQLGVPRSGPLSARLNRFAQTDPRHANTMEALRLVGNKGSHGGNATFADLISCFELVEAAIRDLIDRPNDETDRIARDIISRFKAKQTLQP